MEYLPGRESDSQNISDSEKEQYLQNVAAWLGADWLASDGNHPVKTIWKRRDWLATLELLTVGSALERIKNKTFPRVLKESAKAVRSTDYGNSCGSVFEILASSMFDSPRHPVQMAPAGKSGYDFSVHLPDEIEMRVSCKALVPSKKELLFKSCCQKMCDRLALMLPNGKGTLVKALIAEPTNPKNLDPVYALDGMTKSIIHYLQRTGPQSYYSDGWRFSLQDLHPVSAPRFWTGERSYTFAGLSPHLIDEQRRYDDKIIDAFNNLKKYCSDVSDNKVNAVAIKIPNSISMSRAIEYLQSLWHPDNSHVSMVLIYRSNIATNEAENTSYIHHELKYVSNPHAKFGIGGVISNGFQFDLSVLYGLIGEETTLKMASLSDEADISNCYSFINGRHYYESDIDLNSGGGITHTRMMNTAAFWVPKNLPGTGPSAGDMVLSFILPPSDDLILV